MAGAAFCSHARPSADFVAGAALSQGGVQISLGERERERERERKKEREKESERERERKNEEDRDGGVNRVAGPALWQPKVQISWQAQHFVPMQGQVPVSRQAHHFRTVIDR